MKELRKFLFLITLMIIGYGLTACDSNDKEPEVITLTIEPDSVNIKVGETRKLVVKCNGKVLDNSEVIWKSNNTSYFYIDDEGILTGVHENIFVSGLIIEVTYRKDETIQALCKVNVEGNYTYLYRLELNDKGVVDKVAPASFLSEQAIIRRNKYNIKIDEKDYPVSPDYLRKIEAAGGKIVAKSKWLNTVTIACDGDMSKYKDLSFVKNIILVGKINLDDKNERLNQNIQSRDQSISNGIYGESLSNIELHNGQILHENGFRGDGINIGLIDGSFYKIDENPMLNSGNIKGKKSFTYDYKESEGDTHGTRVFSCMGANKSGKFTGTAPKANYYLFSTEVDGAEQPVEEDYWVSALEYADSIGVQVINTSLYYKYYDWEFESYSPELMNGETAYATRAANIGADKGILIVCCAGNDFSWVGAPADSPKVLAVGSVHSDGKIGNFTNFGFTEDGRIKPDLVSLGMSATIINEQGDIIYGSGTSYASPILCGLAACLWQAYPDLSNIDIIRVLKQAGDRADNPDLPYGYGLPDMQKAMQLAKEKSVYRR